MESIFRPGLFEGDVAIVTGGGTGMGLLLAEGKTLQQAVDSLGHVAEGVSTTREVAALSAQLGVDMPITRAVDRVLAGSLSARDAVEQLLARDPKQE